MPRDGGLSGTEVAAVEVQAQAISFQNRAAFRHAVLTLEHPSFVARLGSLVGAPLDLLAHSLPAEVNSMLSKVVTVALKTAIRVAFATLSRRGSDSTRMGGSNSSKSGAIHKGLAAVSGALGGNIRPGRSSRGTADFYHADFTSGRRYRA